jgi:hypothetical protein
MTYKTKYPHIAAAGFTVEEIAEFFGYKTSASFRSSTKYHKMLYGIDKIISLCAASSLEVNKKNILQALEYVDELREKLSSLDA